MPLPFAPKQGPAFVCRALTALASALLLVQSPVAAPDTRQPTGTDYYFPGTEIQELRASDIPQTCFWHPWYVGNAFAYSKTFPPGAATTPKPG